MSTENSPALPYMQNSMPVQSMENSTPVQSGENSMPGQEIRNSIRSQVSPSCVQKSKMRQHGQSFRDLVQAIQKSRQELDRAVKRLTEQHEQEIAVLQREERGGSRRFSSFQSTVTSIDAQDEEFESEKVITGVGSDESNLELDEHVATERTTGYLVSFSDGESCDDAGLMARISVESSDKSENRRDYGTVQSGRNSVNSAGAQSWSIIPLNKPELREMWAKISKQSRKVNKSNRTTSFAGHDEPLTLADDIVATFRTYPTRLENCMARITVAPSHVTRVCWDLVGALLVACDMVSIPLQVFDLPKSTVSITLGWTILLFWSLDMVFTFFVGFPQKGNIVMSPRRIAIHYLTTWFVLDAVLVIGDWVTTASGSKESDGDSEAAQVSGFSKMLRVLRALRILRLLRLLKLKRLLEELEDMLDSEYVQLMFSLLKLCLAVLAMNHVLACLWFWVGSTSDGAQWVSANHMKDALISYQYVTSLHWALTQFTPATQNIHPYNFPERLLATVVVIMALITFPTFLSTLTATMTQLRKVAADESKQFNMLRRYLNQQKVKTELRRRIVKYLEYAYRTHRHNIREGSVSVLELLSDPLRDELAHARSTPNLSSHPFLAIVNKNWTQLMQRLSRFACGQVYYAADDGIFHRGDAASRMYFLVAGDVDYHWADNRSVVSALAINDWAAEAALWGIWHYVGDLASRTECEVMTIEAIKFGQVMSTNLDVLQVASEYAAKFVRALGDLSPEEYSDILDKDFVAPF